MTLARAARFLPALVMLAGGMLALAPAAQAHPHAGYTQHRAVVVRTLPPGHRYEVVRGTRYVVDRRGRWHRVAGPGWIVVARPYAAVRPLPRAVPHGSAPAPRMRIVPGRPAPAVPARPAPGRGVTLSPRAPIISA